jgi:transcriptional regulator with XRE-family HTH domain
MNNALRTRIRELRKQKCWTQATLAEFCKLSDREIRRIESGKAKPSAETILALAQAFDMDSMLYPTHTNSHSCRNQPTMTWVRRS